MRKISSYPQTKSRLGSEETMLDLKFIRENVDLVREAIAKRQDRAPLDEILELDLERRQKISEASLT